LLLGRVAKVAVILLFDLLAYMAVLSFSLRFGQAGLGPWLCQLGLAFLLPAEITHRALWKKRRSTLPRRTHLGLATAAFLTPSVLAVSPLLSLGCSMALVAAPFYLPRRLHQLLGTLSRPWGRAVDQGDGRVGHDLLLVKVQVRYFRWWGGDPTGRRCRIVTSEGQQYLRVRSIAFTDRACREKAFARAMEEAREAPGVVVPATAEEAICLEAGSDLSEGAVRTATDEKVALAGLSVASRRVLTCSLAGAPLGRGRASDVVIGENGRTPSVKVLSGRPITMRRERLRDMLDLYGMVVAR
jgi:hypothetical protein